MWLNLDKNRDNFPMIGYRNPFTCRIRPVKPLGDSMAVIHRSSPPRLRASRENRNNVIALRSTACMNEMWNSSLLKRHIIVEIIEKERSRLNNRCCKPTAIVRCHPSVIPYGSGAKSKSIFDRPRGLSLQPQLRFLDHPHPRTF
jgi:hypothetical protein